MSASKKPVSAEIVPEFLLEHPLIWMVPSFAINATLMVLWVWMHVLIWGKLLEGVDWALWFAVEV